MAAIVIIGGTGPEGRGLALRLAAAGEAVVIGSRDRARAEAAAAAVRAAVPGATIGAGENHEVLPAGDRVVLAVPFEGLAPLLATMRDRLAGKLVVDVVAPVRVRDGFCELAAIPGVASVGELLQRELPAARVVSALKNVPAHDLAALGTPLEGDVVLCGDDAEARATVAALVARLPRLRPLDAGHLRNARYLEALTALQINLSRRYRAHPSVACPGLATPASA
jgi:NADPH-dependent F420 reductase